MANPYDALLKTDPLETSQVTKPQSGSNPYDTLITETLQDNALDIRRASTLNPQQAKQTMSLTQQTGLPPGVVARNSSTIEQRQKDAETNSVLNEFPALRNLYRKDPLRASLVQNDARELFNLSQTSIFNPGVKVDFPDGDKRYFTQRPTADDFPLSKEQGFAISSAKLRQAQAQWDRADLDRMISLAKIAEQNRSTLDRVGEKGGNLLAASSSAGYGFWKGIVGFAEGTIDTLEPLAEPLAGTILPENPLTRVSEGLKGGRHWLQEQQDRVFNSRMAQMGTVERGIYSGFQSFVQQAPGLIASLYTGNPTPALVSMGVMTGGESYGEAVDEGLSSPRALVYAMSNAFIEVGTERIPLDRLFKSVGLGDPFWKMWLKQQATEIPGEQAATALQDLNEWAVLNPDKTFEDYLEARPGAAAETLVATIVGTSLNAGSIKVIDMALQPAGMDQRRAEERARLRFIEASKASDNADRLRQAGQQMGNLDATELGPEGRQTVGEVLNQSAPDVEVSIDARRAQEVLNQSNVSLSEVGRVSPSFQRQMADAIAQGGEIVLPAGEFVATFGQTELMDPMINIARLGSDEMTLEEATAYMQNANDELKADIEKAMGDAEKVSEFDASKERVRQIIADELNALRRFTNDKNEFDAQLMSSYFATRANQLGMTPEEFFQSRRPQFAAEGMGDQTLDQDATSFFADTTTQYVRDSGFEGAINDDGTVTVYHGTSEENAAQIEQSGQFNGYPFFSPDKAVAERYALQAGGTPKIMELRVDPATIVPTGGYLTARIDGVARDENNVWSAKSNPLYQSRETNAPSQAADSLSQALLEQGVILEGDTIYWSAERMFLMWETFRRANDGGYGTSAAVAWINPADFIPALDATDQTQNTIDYDIDQGVWTDTGERRFVNDGKLDLQALRESWYTGLEIKQTENGFVLTGSHEGRHRMEIMRRAGIAKVPVLLIKDRAKDGKAKELLPGELPENGTIPLDRWDGKEGLPLQYEGAIDLTWDNMDALNERFGPKTESDAYMQSEQPRLSALHNLSSENLVFADQMGGLAMPSIGVVTDEMGVEGYGDITLIGGRNLADPRSSDVYDADAYTVTFPRPQYRTAKRADGDALVNQIDEYVDKYQGEGYQSVISEVFDALVNKGDPSGAINAMIHSNAVKAWFLKEITGTSSRPVIVDVPLRHGGVSDHPDIQAFFKSLPENFNQLGASSDEQVQARKDLVPLLKKALEEHYANAENGAEIAQRHFDFSYDEQEGEVTFTVFDSIHRDQRVIGKRQVDKQATAKRLDKKLKGKEVAFARWVQDKVMPLVGEPYLKIGRKKVPYTLDNIVTQMKKSRGQGMEDVMTFGPGMARAASASRIKSLTEMRNRAEYQLGSEKDVKAAREAANDLLEEYRTAVIEHYNGRNWKGDVDTWNGLDASMKAIALIAKRLDYTTKGLRDALRRHDFTGVPESALELGVKAAKAMLKAPVPYFEAKPPRAVTLDEFAGAAVPNDVSQEVLDVLKKHNIQVIKYGKRYNEEQRTAAVTSLRNRLAAQGLDVLFQNAGRRGSFEPATNTIRMFQAADLSTFLHEAGHFFFENDIAVASTLINKESLTAGEQQVLADVQALLDWVGVKGDMQEKINTWYLMSLDEKRGFHEKMAESFERYLFTGKAPSVELQSAFQNFRNWLVSVYKSIKDFLARYPDAKGLTPEIRDVFDRMLATDEQIAVAQEAASALPMFAEQADSNLTQEEWEAYKRSTEDARNEAIDELEAKSLSDLQWADRAQQREVKKLKKESEDTRRQVRMEVRGEILQEPLYRAWSFLTGKVGKDEKLSPMPEAPKSKKGPVDPEIDTLFTAIAKLGGLNRDEVTRTWGTDPTERSPQPLFGMPVVRKEGGRSIDDMVEALSQYGYLTLDENGKADVADLEAKFDDSWRGEDVYSDHANYDKLFGAENLREGDQAVTREDLRAGRIDLTALETMDLPAEVVQRLKDLKMTVGNRGFDPDVLAEMFGFTSGDQLMRELGAAETLYDAIEGRTDQIMLERHGNLATPEAIRRAAAEAVHNQSRVRMYATELDALGRALGRDQKERRATAAMAMNMAERKVSGTKVRDLKPHRYTQVAAKAGRNSLAAQKRGDTQTAYTEKHMQVIQSALAKVSTNARDEAIQIIKYLKRFEKESIRKGIHIDHREQIDTLLDRYDLRTGESIKKIDRRKRLQEWVQEQEDSGIEVDIPAHILDEANRQHFKDLTMEELRGLRDTVKQMEHIGRRWDRVLTAKDNRLFADVIKELVQSIDRNAQKYGKERSARYTDTGYFEGTKDWVKNFLAEHRKVASLAREMDGFEDAGAMWTYIIQGMNDAGGREADMRAKATKDVLEILKPLLSDSFKNNVKLFGKGIYFKGLGRSLSREQRISVVLNMGNDGNRQRLMDGAGWSEAAIQEVADSLTADELAMVQKVWDYFETYRPMVAAKERRVMGKEPDWVEPVPLVAKNGTLRGGYFPIVYDPKASVKAADQETLRQAKMTSGATYVNPQVSRSFVKRRASEVKGRPLMLNMTGLFRGVNEVIHDLTWHEWVIDARRIMKHPAVAQLIREYYGVEKYNQFNAAIGDIAAGDNVGADALDRGFGHIRAGAAVAGLGFNLMNAMIQPFGLTQSMVRIGSSWVMRGMGDWIRSPVQTVTDIQAKSPMMRTRWQTLQRELNEAQSIVQGKGKVRKYVDPVVWFPMQAMQMAADIPTWVGQYKKALADAPIGLDQDAVEDRAIRLADAAVLESQSGGQIKDLSKIQRGSNAKKMWSVFYGYFSATWQLTAEVTGRTNFKNPIEAAAAARDYALLLIVPSLAYTGIKNLFQCDSDNEDCLMAFLEDAGADMVSMLMGLFVGVRELTPAVQAVIGFDTYGYSGPGGSRIMQDLLRLGQQINQGELDESLRRTAVNAVSVATKLPGAQINRTLDGVDAMIKGKTNNPAVLVGGYRD